MINSLILSMIGPMPIIYVLPAQNSSIFSMTTITGPIPSMDILFIGWNTFQEFTICSGLKAESFTNILVLDPIPAPTHQKLQQKRNKYVA